MRVNEGAAQGDSHGKVDEREPGGGIDHILRLLDMDERRVRKIFIITES